MAFIRGTGRRARALCSIILLGGVAGGCAEASNDSGVAEAVGGAIEGAAASAKPDLIPYCGPNGIAVCHQVCTGTGKNRCNPGFTECVCEATCPFSSTCPPGMYNTTPGGYTGAFATSGSSIEPVGCTFTAPPATACQTAPGDNIFGVPSFVAPTITSVVLGGGTVYGIGNSASSIVGDNIEEAAVFAWGDNRYHQLGNGTTTTSTTPQVPIYIPGNPVAQVAAGDTDACALMGDGTVYCWGTIMTHPEAIVWSTATPVQFPPGTPKIVQITHGDHHACALTAFLPPPSHTGEVLCWGDNGSGQLGVSPDQTGGLNSAYEGTPLAVDVAGGFVAARGSGEVPGELLSVVASGNSTCVLAHGIGTASSASREGVYCWGDDTAGSLGDLNGAPGNSTYQAVQAHPLLDGFGDQEDFVALTGANIGSQGYIGSFCALAGVDGNWACWGADDVGQLDIAPPPPPSSCPACVQGVLVPTPIADSSIGTSQLAIGPDHGCAQIGSFTYCFGDNDEGQLGIPATAGAGTPDSPPEASAPPATFPATFYTSVAVGANTSCGIYVGPGSDPPSSGAGAGGNIACWGGDGDLMHSYSPVLLTW